jgi:L-fuconolactonase
MSGVGRRTFLGAAAAVGIASTGEAQAAPIPIIDCHIHLFDQTRAQGVPYSGGSRNTEPALPARYKRLAAPLGIVGAIEVEASPWVEDNLWVLEVEEKDPVMVGMIGNLRPEKPEFGEYLERYHRNKLFLGIRYGNLWGYSLVDQVSNPVFVEGLKLLQQADLVLDTANPRPDLMEAILRLSDRVPDLRMILDHVPGMLLRLDTAARKRVEATLGQLAKRPRIYVKVSQMLQIANGKAVTDAAVYRPALDYLFDTFGEDRLIFGSDWPNEWAVDNLAGIVQIVREYFGRRGRAAAEKYFWRNSVEAYRWVRREGSQMMG